MEKRTLLFIIISLAVIIVWDYLFLPKKTTPPPFPSNSSLHSDKIPTKGRGPSSTANGLMEKSDSTTTSLIDISTDIYKGSFAKERGFFKNLLLKNYFFDKNKQKFVDLLRDGFVDISDVLFIGDKAYRVEYKDLKITDLPTAIELTLSGDVNAIKIDKIVTIDKKDYKGKIYYRFTSSLDEMVKITPSIVISQKFKSSNTAEEGNPMPHFFANKSYETPSERQLKKTFKVDKVSYGGVAEKYFALFFVDPKESLMGESLLKDEHIETTLFISTFNLQKGTEAAYELVFFGGPKDPKLLKTFGNHLNAAVDYGFFHFIARPLLIILNFFYNYTGNYGVSIILLTILIKLAFFPLSHKSYKSMKELQKLQPKMEELRKKYANDKEALNREMMLLYKRHGVNPLSGCLPMLVQIPFFIALYQALMNAIELRQAPFILWITDLSAKDPYYVTPILMGLTMLIQQVLTPSSGDPTQKKMMYILPVVFTFMFLNFPSGLVLYWLVNNLFSILQQLYTIKKQEA